MEKPFRSSISPTQCNFTNAASQVLGPNAKRVAVILSGGATAYSVSFGSTPVLGLAMVNMLAAQVWVQVLTCEELGDAITQPIYGIASGNVTVEITEVMRDET